MFIMSVPLKETEASLLLKGETEGGALYEWVFCNESDMPWVAITAFSVDRLDEELLFIPPPSAPSVSFCLCVVLKASVFTSISSIRPVSGLHLSCTFGSY